MSTDADYTLSELYDKGVDALSEKDPEVGATYEVGRGIVGTLQPPTLRAREAFAEADEKMSALYKDEAQLEDGLAEKLEAAEEEEDLMEVLSNLYREDVSVRDIQMTRSRVACWQAAEVLTFEDDVDPGDLVPEMCVVVRVHFLSLGRQTPKQQRPS